MCGFIVVFGTCPDVVSSIEVRTRAEIRSALQLRGTIEGTEWKAADGCSIGWHARMPTSLSSDFSYPLSDQKTGTLNFYNGNNYFAEKFTPEEEVSSLLSGLTTRIPYGSPFSLCSFDPNKRLVDFGSDFFGERPLFFFQDNTVLVVSNSLKALFKFLESKQGKARLSEADLVGYLGRGYVTPKIKIHGNIQRALPGYLYRFSLNSGQIKAEYLKKLSFYKIDAGFEKILAQNGLRQPVIALSDGVDSRYLYRIWASKIKSNVFLWRYIFSKNTVQILVSKCFRIRLLSQIQRPTYGDLSSSYDLPSTDGQNIYNLIQSSKSHLDDIDYCLYTGTAADEILGGYSIYVLFALPKWVRKIVLRYKFFEFDMSSFDLNDIFHVSYLYRFDKKFYFANRSTIEDSMHEDINGLRNFVCETVPEFDKYDDLEKIRYIQIFDYLYGQLFRVAEMVGYQSNVDIRNPFTSLGIPNRVDFKARILPVKFSVLGIIYVLLVKRGFTFKHSESSRRHLDGTKYGMSGDICFEQVQMRRKEAFKKWI